MTENRHSTGLGKEQDEMSGEEENKRKRKTEERAERKRATG